MEMLETIDVPLCQPPPKKNARVFVRFWQVSGDLCVCVSVSVLCVERHITLSFLMFCTLGGWVRIKVMILL